MQAVKLNPIRQRTGPKSATAANDFLKTPREIMSFLDNLSASQDDGKENSNIRRYGRADKKPF